MFDLALRLCFYRLLVLLYKYININTCFTFTRHIGKPVSNTTKSLCIPWSWTNNLSRWNKRHRKNGGWLFTIRGVVEFVQRKPPWMKCKRSLSPLLLKAVCVIVVALMHYFLMAAFCWMLVEEIHLHLFVVKVSNINTKMHMYHVISWGILIFQLNLSYTVRDYFVTLLYHVINSKFS